MKSKRNIIYWDNGNIQYDEWRLEEDGVTYHREDGPADVWHYYNGTIEEEHWIVRGFSHREDGPAFISYNEDGSIIRKDWWYKNNRILKEDFTYEKAVRMNATEIFTPVELARLRVQSGT
jgi:hypothetical protein